IGIAQDKQKHVFGTFTQADSETTRKYGGTGLGLAITKRLVELLGGDISCQSEVGTGSVFSIRLPLDVSPSTEAQLETEKSLNSAACGDAMSCEASMENAGMSNAEESNASNGIK
ncbi:MAG: histidine kinase, partial [Planctomycetes bacterium]|nr:histidine kinase [Planctomycetota bacterium]